MNEPEQNLILDIVTLKDGVSARDVRGNVYKIESITLGMDRHRHTLKYEKNFIKPDTEVRAELLKNGKLNIIP